MPQSFSVGPLSNSFDYGSIFLSFAHLLTWESAVASVITGRMSSSDLLRSVDLHLHETAAVLWLR